MWLLQFPATLIFLQCGTVTWNYEPNKPILPVLLLLGYFTAAMGKETKTAAINNNLSRLKKKLDSPLTVRLLS